MRILVLFRVYTGMVESISTGIWRPKGVPTFYKMIESLDASEHDTHFILNDRGQQRALHCILPVTSPSWMQFEALKTPIRILSGENAYPAWLGRWRATARFIRHLWVTLKEISSWRPDVIYLDRSNVVLGAFLVRFFSQRVVLRVMGITPDMWTMLPMRRPGPAIVRWAYRSRFAHVLCTQDGSGGASWLGELLLPSVPRTILLNGVNREAPGDDPMAVRDEWGISREKMLVLWVSRLEPAKNILLFIEALAAQGREGGRRMEVLIVGEGSQREVAEAMCKDADIDDWVHFTGGLPHDRVLPLYDAADVFVVLNKTGIFSNTTLEALSAGLCILYAKPDHVDDALVNEMYGKLLPEDGAISLEYSNLADQTCSALVRLAEAPDERARRAKKIKQCADRNIRTWHDRATDEIGILESAAK